MFRMRYLVACTLFALLLSGCSKETVDFNFDDTPIEEKQTFQEDEMRVKILTLHPYHGENIFYLRAHYNAAKDILILFYQNVNGVISPRAVYIGSKAMSDAEMMNTENSVVHQGDSTGPLSGSSAYWCLFAQHGYSVPTIANNVGLSSDDVGTLWKDQLNRQYTIGQVTATTITLLPVIYKTVSSHDMRGWQSPSSAAITTLTRVGFSDGVAWIPVKDYGRTQLTPIMRSENRVYMADGQPITTEGYYTVKQFSVGETQIGYDPATITSWFPTPRLDDAMPMARFTWRYDFCGAQCSVHTTIDILREVQFMNYCPSQQQTFTDLGTYKAMFMIPKAAPQDGVDFERPFHSPGINGQTHNFYRTEQYLRNVNDLIDRMLAFLHDDKTDDYLLGMAVGLSLVEGDTRPKMRVRNILYGDENQKLRVCRFSPDNVNKFYLSALNASPFADKDYYWPVGYSSEIDYYVSFFDPAANEGQVYWYKDGHRYVIYAHCQTQHDKLDITVPDFMNGCTLQVVEKTPAAQLLSGTIQDRRFAVKYADAAANYLVLTATPSSD